MKSVVKSDTTYVKFANLTEEQIISYVNNYKPLDKAGSYGIQELPEGYVESVDGEFDNVIGFPSKLFLSMLNTF